MVFILDYILFSFVWILLWNKRQTSKNRTGLSFAFEKCQTISIIIWQSKHILCFAKRHDFRFVHRHNIAVPFALFYVRNIYFCLKLNKSITFCQKFNLKHFRRLRVTAFVLLYMCVCFGQHFGGIYSPYRIVFRVQQTNLFILTAQRKLCNRIQKLPADWAFDRPHGHSIFFSILFIACLCYRSWQMRKNENKNKTFATFVAVLTQIRRKKTYIFMRQKTGMAGSRTYQTQHFNMCDMFLTVLRVYVTGFER